MAIIYVQRESENQKTQLVALTQTDKDGNQLLNGSDAPVIIVAVNHQRLHEGRAFFASHIINNGSTLLRKSVIWNTVLDEAMGMRCGNCAAFIQTEQMLECIKAGIEAKNPAEESGYDEDVIETAQLGFCELFHFKCAGTRTCDAWLVGGPIKDETEED